MTSAIVTIGGSSKSRLRDLQFGLGALLKQKPVNVITLTLLHPNKSIPLRVWTFEQEEIIRIGRSVKNDVVLYSAVVSRCHAELRREGGAWRVIGLGTNGTYLDGRLIRESPIVDGQILHLAISGPKIQLSILSDQAQPSMGGIGIRQKSIKTVDDLETEVKVDQVPISSRSSQLIDSELDDDITMTE